MAENMSNKIRAYAEDKYVGPARRAGRRRFAIPVREVLNSMVEREGLPRQNVPQVCQALRSPRKFLDPLGLEIERVDGPEKQTSTTVVFHYRFQDERLGDQGEDSPGGISVPASGSVPGLAISNLYGLLRDELAEYGGGEAFLKWLRADPDKDIR